MFQHILVPLDGSPRAEQALPFAARIARAAKGTLTLLYVVTHPADFSMFPDTSGLIEEAVEEDITEAKAYLANVSLSETLEGLGVKTEVIAGVATHAILEFARTRQVDLIVLCSHGNTGVRRWVMGSVALHVSRHSSVPVLVLHEDSPFSLPIPEISQQPFRLLLALDGSPLSETALLPAAQLCADLAFPAQGCLHLALVIRHYPFMPGKPDDIARMHEEDMAVARLYLSDVVRHIHEGKLAALDLQLASSIISGPDIAEALIKAAENGESAGDSEGVNRCHVIAMATHGRSGMARWVMGSTTERVLGATKLPLLIVRPQVSEAEENVNHSGTIDEHTGSEYPDWVGLL